MKKRTTTVDDIALSAVLATLLLTCALSVWAAPPIDKPYAFGSPIQSTKGKS